MLKRAGLLFAVMATCCKLAAEVHAFPVTVDNCSEPLIIKAPPQRAVIHDINMTEMAFALGLQPRMIGVTGITGWHKASATFKAALGNIPELASKYPTLENLLAARPDFFFAGWYYGMKPGGDITPARLAQHGIQTLVLTESCIHGGRERPKASLALLYNDMLRLGSVFGKRSEAEQLVAQWRLRIQALQSTPSASTSTQPLRVFVYDSGEDKPFTAGRAAMPTALIEAAGGRNIMDDMSTSWGYASWESVASRNPQLLILLDYQDGHGPSRLLATLQAHPAMRHTEAVKRQRYIALRYSELTPGPANIEAIEKIARALRAIE
jgi:iron complex transport system substrate-binding protein